ncbi:lipopolysaccharide biosynthesis protein [Marinigracilibium pacificum]|uniref:O-antigen/teichoic acid export membrane protein n=1 Tax=Marinigracilibium pacificum TaxID=2729599 RepID=A0A848J3U4_9BACT|nr:polysaccharide biosynthesis C-terminal domain-containing protein [Marinigracilibium pacificum]NMM49154.1 hypothetical protein [Marinigracilibium pacificum]
MPIKDSYLLKQGFFSTFFTYSGVAVGAFNYMYLFPKVFTTTEIGLIRTILSVAGLLVPLAQFGLAQIVIKFFEEYKLKNNQHGFIGLTIIFAAILSISFYIISLFCEPLFIGFFKERTAEIIPYYQNIVLITVLLSLYNTTESISRVYNKLSYSYFLRNLLLRLFISLSAILFALQIFNLDKVVTFITYGHLICFILLIPLVIGLIGLKRSILPKREHIQESRKFINYGFYSFLALSGGLILLQVDTIMVSKLMGLDSSGVYSTLFFFAIVIELPGKIIRTIYTPLISSEFARSNFEEINKYYKKAAYGQTIIATLIFAIILASLESIIKIIPNYEEYLAAKNIVIILGLAKMTDMISGNNSEIIAVSKYYRYNVYAILILAVCTVLFNYILIPEFGMNGAAFASLISLALFNILKYTFLKRKLNLQPLGKSYLKMTIFVILVLGIAYFLPQYDSILLTIVLNTSLIGVLYLILYKIFPFHPDINSWLNEKGIKI